MPRKRPGAAGSSIPRSTTGSNGRAEAVYRATLAIATELSLDAVLQKIVDATRELVNARYAALGVVDEERRRLTHFVVSGISAEEIRAIEHWPHGLGLLGELIHFPRPLRVRDISKDPRSVGFPANHPPMRSFLGVPVIRGEKVLGNFYMTDKIGADEFSEDDEELLSLFAAYAAIAIENARLYTETDIRLKEKVIEVERAEKRARFLADLGSLLLRLSPGEDLPLAEIAEQATEPLGDAVGIILVDPAKPRDPVSQVMFHRIPDRGQAAEDLVRRSWTEIRDHVVIRREAVLSRTSPGGSGAAIFESAALEAGRFTAAVAVPIATRHAGYGLLLSLASRPVTLTEEDLRFASLMADRIGSALEAANFYRQQQEAEAQTQQLAILAETRAGELETILDTMTEAVYVADRDLRLVHLNRAFARLLGLADASEAEGPFWDLIQRLHPQTEMEGLSPDDLPMLRALAGESFTNHILRITPIGGAEDRFLSVSGAPIRDAKGNIVAAVNVARDVTELREVDRLKDEFISVASHEMRTPLTVIKGYAQILAGKLEAAGAQPSQIQMAKQILGQTERLTALTNRLLDVSRVQFGRLSLEMDTVDLAALVRDVAEQMRVGMEFHPIKVTVEGPVTARADAGRLEQVLTNLITNAGKYSPDGTEIDVSLKRDNDSALISVRDYGPGIPKERQARIFQRFYRASTNERKTGLGLGLYVSKGIVDAHHGEIWFESEDGRGSTFYVRLPAE